MKQCKNCKRIKPDYDFPLCSFCGSSDYCNSCISQNDGRCLNCRSVITAPQPASSRKRGTTSTIRKRFLGKRGKRIPILGVRGAGKSYFLCTLGWVLGYYRWGHPDSETNVYFNDMMKFVLRHEPIPSTYKGRPIVIELDQVDLGCEVRRCNLVLSSEDYSGQEYETAMERFRIMEEGEPPDELVETFYNMILDSEAVIVIVDLVGRSPLTPEQFKKHEEKYVFNALSEQVSPLVTGIELLLKSGKNLSNKPFFFVFTKSDVHGLTTREVSKYFDRAMAITMKRLSDRGVVFKKYAVSSVGWGADGNLDSMCAQGFIELIMDIAKLVKR